jgi:hypothetical protein
MLKTAHTPQPLRNESASHGRLIADTASVRQWLAEGLSIADVLTMLEVRRRFEFSAHNCRIYAVEILSAVRAELQRLQKWRKEGDCFSAAQGHFGS